MQLNGESNETFTILSLDEVEIHIKESKQRAVKLANQCDTTHLIEDAIQHDQENENITNIQADAEKGELGVIAASDIACIKD